MTRIKPLLIHQIHLKSLYNYHNFLKRRPKNPQTLKFSAQGDFPKNIHRQVRVKLLKALELARPIRKIDFSQNYLELDSFGKSQLLCAFKKISKVKSISIERIFQSWKEENCVEKSLKYLKEVQYLSFKLFGSYYNDVRDCDYPLKYLRYCSKLKKMLIGNSYSRCYCFKKSSLTKRTTKMKNHAVNNLLLDKEYSHKFLHEIISIDFKLNDHFTDQLAAFIQELPNLQEISLNFQNPFVRELAKILKKVVKNGVLKKFQLKFHFIVPVPGFNKILEILKVCKLTTFSLTAEIKENQHLASIAGFLKHMNHLESLKLNIDHKTYFDNASKGFIEICQQISKLEKLQHLKLVFNKERKTLTKEQRLPNFLTHLYPVFKKPIKLKTLSLSCNQIDHSEAFLALIAALQNLSTSLCKLKVDLGLPSRSSESLEFAANFIKNLHNLKVLKLPCLSINKKKNLNTLIEAVLGLKGLEELILGEIDQNIEAPVFFNTIERIFCKRGLRKFHCQTTKALQEKIQVEIASYKEDDYDVQKFLKANPCLEDVKLSSLGIEWSLNHEIQKWSMHKARYCDIFKSYEKFIVEIL